MQATFTPVPVKYVSDYTRIQSFVRAQHARTAGFYDSALVTFITPLLSRVKMQKWQNWAL